MKTIYKTPVSPEELSKFDVHQAGINAILSQVNLKNLRIIRASNEEKGVDLIIKNKISKNVYRMKVFATKKPPKNTSVGHGLSWLVKPGDLKSPDDDLFFAFVHININKNMLSYRFFILPSRDAVKYVINSFNYWRDELKTRDETNKVKKLLLGEEGEKYPTQFKTFMQNECEDNWNLLK